MIHQRKEMIEIHEEDSNLAYIPPSIHLGIAAIDIDLSILLLSGCNLCFVLAQDGNAYN
jgi:hypothetical protein